MIYLTVCPSICVLPSLQVFPPVLITWVQQLWARDDWYFHHSRSISQQSWGSPSCNSFTSSYFQQFLICSSPFPGIKNARQGQVSEQQGSYQEHGSFPMQPKDSKGCGLVLWTQNSCSACAEAFMFVTCCCHLIKSKQQTKQTKDWFGICCYLSWSTEQGRELKGRHISWEDHGQRFSEPNQMAEGCG